ncbi:CLUMA_CG019644, isoform A [Clunio marinus]|uniref:CLUMA_CG019644, isoform A n=1 Tax=Clunio marinus TaxID=568069 RepID=A0A1J1J777_9DIPT|nr:CLUMA_CG019644, isoform A [Clunio marinus]
MKTQYEKFFFFTCFSLFFLIFRYLPLFYLLSFLLIRFDLFDFFLRHPRVGPP